MVEHKQAGLETNRIQSGPMTFREVVEEVYDNVADIERANAENS